MTYSLLSCRTYKTAQPPCCPKICQTYLGSARVGPGLEISSCSSACSNAPRRWATLLLNVECCYAEGLRKVQRMCGCVLMLSNDMERGGIGFGARSVAFYKYAASPS